VKHVRKGSKIPFGLATTDQPKEQAMKIKLTCPRCGNTLFNNGMTKPNYCGACEQHCAVTTIEIVEDAQR
jgi:uncharacterized protein (DUF983 family)